MSDNETESEGAALRRIAGESIERQAAVDTLTEENYKLMQALVEIAIDSEEAGAVRVAVTAICSVTNGPSFLQAHPLC